MEAALRESFNREGMKGKLTEVCLLYSSGALTSSISTFSQINPPRSRPAIKSAALCWFEAGFTLHVTEVKGCTCVVNPAGEDKSSV